MNTSPEFVPKGFHIEHVDQPTEPMDILVENSALKLHVDLLAESTEIVTPAPSPTVKGPGYRFDYSIGRQAALEARKTAIVQKFDTQE